MSNTHSVRLVTPLTSSNRAAKLISYASRKAGPGLRARVCKREIYSHTLAKRDIYSDAQGAARTAREAQMMNTYRGFSDRK